MILSTKDQFNIQHHNYYYTIDKRINNNNYYNFDKRVNIDARDNGNRTPLRLALSPDAYGDFIPTYPEFQRISCKTLITHGADILFSSSSLSLLFSSLLFHHYCLLFFFDGEVDVNAVDNQNRSILDYALNSNLVDIIAVLISLMQLIVYYYC